MIPDMVPKRLVEIACRCDFMRARHLSVGACILASLMSTISEDGYCAGWLCNLEYSLWVIAHHGGGKFGQSEVTSQQADDLLWLADYLGGWVVWTNEEQETFVTMDQWLKTVGVS